MLPTFDADGNLPEGVHRASEAEIFERFTTFSARRQWLGDRLRELVTLAKETGHLSRLILWGSLVTDKEAPNDIDVLLIMRADFRLEQTAEPHRALFAHTEARLRFHADVFWTNESVDPAILQLWLDTYQVGRDFRRRGIVEMDVS